MELRWFLDFFFCGEELCFWIGFGWTGVRFFFSGRDVPPKKRGEVCTWTGVVFYPIDDCRLGSTSRKLGGESWILFKLRPEVFFQPETLVKSFPSKAGVGFKFGLSCCREANSETYWAEARVAGLEAQQEAVEEGKGWWRCIFGAPCDGKVRLWFDGLWRVKYLVEWLRL